jgi:hypothetical protein
MIESTVVEPVPVVAGQAFRLTVTARDDGPPEALEFALNGGFSGPWVGGFWGPDWKRITPAETQCGEVVVEVIGPDRSEAAITCSLPVDTIAGAWRTTVSVRDGVPDSVWSEVVEFRVQGAASQ